MERRRATERYRYRRRWISVASPTHVPRIYETPPDTPCASTARPRQQYTFSSLCASPAASRVEKRRALCPPRAPVRALLQALQPSASRRGSLPPPALHSRAVTGRPPERKLSTCDQRRPGGSRAVKTLVEGSTARRAREGLRARAPGCCVSDGWEVEVRFLIWVRGAAEGACTCLLFFLHLCLLALLAVYVHLYKDIHTYTASAKPLPPPLPPPSPPPPPFPTCGPPTSTSSSSHTRSSPSSPRATPRNPQPPPPPGRPTSRYPSSRCCSCAMHPRRTLGRTPRPR